MYPLLLFRIMLRIQLGGNLDSVQDGAGINDNGSGVSALLELIMAVAQYSTTQKIRFIWWGAEENGQLGSYHYTKALSATEIKNIAMYLNIGSHLHFAILRSG